MPYTAKMNTPKRWYKITDSHRNQTFSAVFRKQRDSDAWKWESRIEFTDGQSFEFSSQRNFTTASEAEDCMRQFACARIDHHLTR
jgi:hypothetical protein